MPITPSNRFMINISRFYCCFAFYALLTAIGFSHADEPNRKLVWSDEFEGSKLDFSKWEIEVNAFGGGNQELQIYTDRKENVRVQNGHLIIEARKGLFGIAGTERPFSSGRIRSKNRGDWKYGRFEVKAKLPPGPGLWPAIWMLPTEENYGGWASSGEIDIMEFKGQEPKRVHGTLHYGDVWPRNKFTGKSFDLKNSDFTSDFHVFALEWEKGEMRWYVDDVLYQTQKEWQSAGGDFPAPFDSEFHLLLNLAVGGGFVGNPDDTTAFPAKFVIDYVRVYQ